MPGKQKLRIYCVSLYDHLASWEHTAEIRYAYNILVGKLQGKITVLKIQK
jgi:hypothetical protein